MNGSREEGRLPTVPYSTLPLPYDTLRYALVYPLSTVRLLYRTVQYTLGTLLCTFFTEMGTFGTFLYTFGTWGYAWGYLLFSTPECTPNRSPRW